jgi:hypothetical protein
VDSRRQILEPFLHAPIKLSFEGRPLLLRVVLFSSLQVSLKEILSSIESCGTFMHVEYIQEDEENYISPLVRPALRSPNELRSLDSVVFLAHTPSSYYVNEALSLSVPVLLFPQPIWRLCLPP